MISIPKKRFETLDSLRGVCAILVLCYHVRIYSSFTETSIIRSANFFVEFFFVLSGFVMLHSYGKQQFDRPRLGSYMKSRFFRLYPLHLAMLIVVVGIELIKLYVSKIGLNFNNVPFTASTTPNQLLPNLLLLNAILPSARSMTFNIVSWSISVEFFLYILLGLVLFRNTRTRNTLFCAIMLLGFYLLLINNTLIFKVELLRGLSCFFGGCICYLIYEAVNITRPMKALFTFLELLVIGLICAILMAPFGNKGPVISLTFFFAVWVFAQEKGAVSNLLRHASFKYLGKLSYSIYMVHYVFWYNIIALAIILSKLMHREFTANIFTEGKMVRMITVHNYWLAQLTILGIMGSIIVISHFTYKYIELKGIALGKRFSQLKPITA